MNFVFISPQFPKTYWNFCDRLKRNGVTTLGIGDTPYDQLDEPVRASLTEYYKVNSLENYDEVFRAVAYFSFRYGKIDWLESNNEYWLEQDARLRTDFHITTGVNSDEIANFKSKAAMKPFYEKAGVPTARFHHAVNRREDQKFIDLVGYPVIAKPNVGVGANDTYKLENEEDFDRFCENRPAVPYIMEEFVTGDIYSYDAITDADCNIIFETMTIWPPSIMDIVNQGLELAYYTAGGPLPEKFARVGRNTVKAFGVKSRFVHMEFFCLTKAKKGLGEVGDFVGLEVNMRPAGGYTPDMFNFAGSVDVYQIWADMIAFNESRQNMDLEKFYCVYASQRDGKAYLHSHEEILSAYGSRMVMCDRIPEILSAAMGNQMYTVKLKTKEETDAFIRYVTERRE